MALNSINIPQVHSALFSRNAWKPLLPRFCLLVAFIYGFYMDMQYECGNAFTNLKCVPEPFFLTKHLKYTNFICTSFHEHLKFLLSVFGYIRLQLSHY